MSEGDEFRRLLGIVSDKGLRALSVPELDTLRTLLAAKSYEDKKAEKSRKKLIRQINAEIYNKYSPRRLF